MAHRRNPAVGGVAGAADAAAGGPEPRASRGAFKWVRTQEVASACSEPKTKGQKARLSLPHLVNQYLQLYPFSLLALIRSATVHRRALRCRRLIPVARSHHDSARRLLYTRLLYTRDGYVIKSRVAHRQQIEPDGRSSTTIHAARQSRWSHIRSKIARRNSALFSRRRRSGSPRKEARGRTCSRQPNSEMQMATHSLVGSPHAQISRAMPRRLEEASRPRWAS